MTIYYVKATSIDGCISDQSVTASGTGSVYEQLSLTFTPTFTGTIQVRLFAPETTAGATATFSDLRL